VCRPLRPARGASLVELLVGMLMGLIVLGIALQLVLFARARYQRIADEALIEDRGTQALELFTTAVQQAGWITDTPAWSPMRRWPDAGAPPSLLGADNCGPPLSVDDLHCGRGVVGASDALLVRFSGRSSQADGRYADGTTVIDCSGYGVPERIQGGGDDPRAGFMLLYIYQASGSSEPQLMCRSHRRDKKQLQPDFAPALGMVRGVETLQLLYTVSGADGAPATIASARALDRTQWHRVQAVHVALVVRGDYNDPSAAGETKQDRQFTPFNTQRRRAAFNATCACAIRCPARSTHAE
jgi:type IV pilus assembly protein PilW